MPKISDEPLEAIQVRLFESDLTFLRRFYAGNTGVNNAIRTIVRTYVRQAKARADAEIDSMPQLETLLEG